MPPYEPKPLPPTGLDLARLIGLVGEANTALAHYDGLLQAMVNPAVLLSPLTNQEAVLSSKIEGTQATIEEVLEHEAGQEHDESKSGDIQEILNYRKALVLGGEAAADRPISLGLIRELHRVLMDTVRGQDKKPGEFRQDQNWIGPPGSTIDSATFVPPHPLQLPNHLSAWEAYMGGTDFDALVQSAVVHAQFELLHPFRDGNGRIGRLLIPLFLYSKKRLSSPMFYLSAYLEAHRDTYYARLQAISRDEDWTGWICFFLTAIAEQARLNASRTRAIMRLHESMKARVRDIARSQHTAQLVDALFDRPIFRISDFSRRTGIPKPSLHNLLRQLEEAAIIRTLRPAAGRRPSILVFPELLAIAESTTFPASPHR
jgi:Fic family protein